MEVLLTALASQMIPIIGTILAGLATLGIVILKKKVGNDLAATALDQVNQVTSAVVGQLTQTAAEGLKASQGGKLTDTQKNDLKNTAINQITALLSNEVKTAAEKVVSNLNAYIAQKIEEQVLAQKK